MTRKDDSMVDDPVDARRKFPPLTPKEKRLVRQGALLPRDMRWILDEERERIRLFTEARLKELTDIVEAYEAGALTWQQADKRLETYRERWDVPFTYDNELEGKYEKQAFENAHGFKPDWERMSRENKEFFAAERERRERREHEKRHGRS